MPATARLGGICARDGVAVVITLTSLLL